MVTPEKINEWIKEAEERPASAAQIIKYISERLRDLSARNEELLADNISLQSGQRVEEYKKRIAYLEYQLDLLKRQLTARSYSGEEESLETGDVQGISVLAYQAQGRILQLEMMSICFSEDKMREPFGKIVGDHRVDGEPTRLLVSAPSEEMLQLFTSGRVNPVPILDIPVSASSTDSDWQQAFLSGDIRAGEKLVCLMPLGGLPLADFFIQVSRRGCVKKTMTSMAENILSNRYIGKGVVQKADQPFELMLAHKGDRLILVTWEGRLACLDVDDLSYATEERVRLNATDHVVSAFIAQPDSFLLSITQAGKVLQQEIDTIESVRSPLAKGLALIPSSRLEQGTRLVGAGSVREPDWCLSLHESGQLHLRAVRDLFIEGAFSVGKELITFTAFQYPVK